MSTLDCLIAGGGAAGCYAAITAARRGRRVGIVEHNPKGELGKKLRITGKGRCNVTNNCDRDTLLANTPRNGRFLYSAFSACSPADVMEFFEALGVRLKTERGNRVFPVSDSAGEIVSALRQECRRLGVQVIPGQVTDLLLEDGCCRGLLVDGAAYEAESVLLATGGMSYPATGSTGDGYGIARRAGHTIVPPEPSLVPLVIREKQCRDMMGLSLRNVTLSLYDGKKCLFQELGEMLFTHFGVSGPLVLSASCHIPQMEPDRYTLSIDLKPGLTPEQMDLRLQRDFQLFQNRTLFNALSKLLPKGMIPAAIQMSGMDGNIRVNQITKAQRLAFGAFLKAFPLTVQGFRPISEAIITRGGVSVKEVSPKTMESKLLPGLFFAGELLDVDAYTGGFNLQIAFATGYAAGCSM